MKSLYKNYPLGVVNATLGTVIYYSDIFDMKDMEGYTVIVNYKKTSGTLAGTIIIQRSYDDNNYVNTTTLTLTDSSVDAQLSNTLTSPMQYRRVKLLTTVTSGIGEITMSISAKGV